jgi:linearmycin/streptolysin S transport system permease protein
MNSRTLRTTGALVYHFFAHSLSRPVTWLVFIILPAAAIVGMHLLIDYPGTGLLLFTVMLQACTTAALSTREKEIGVYHRILAAPISTTTYTVALFIAVFLVVVVEVVIVLGVMLVAVPGPVGISFPMLLPVMLTFAAMAGAYGVMITAFVNTYTQATVVANITVIFSSMMSGCVWPLSIMPDYMQTIARVLPQTWANLALEELSRGASLRDVSLHLVILLLYGAAFLLVFGLWRRRANAAHGILSRL